MFGISFGELALIGLVALLVLGPERLPGAARTAGLWVGRLRRSFNAIKHEVEREIGADEIRRQLRNEEILSLEREMRNAIRPPEPSQPAPAQTVEVEPPKAVPEAPGTAETTPTPAHETTPPRNP